MSTVNLGRLRLKWRGLWAGSTAYVKDDIVRYGVDSYICTTAHTSPGAFSTSDGWELMMQGTELPAQSGYTDKVLTTDGTNPGNLSWGDSGKVLQTKTISANYNWGSVGNSSHYHCSWLDQTFVAKGTNSKYFLSACIPTDDTNSSSYGVGLGFWFGNDTRGGSWWVEEPAQHEQYMSVGSDTYFLAHKTLLWDPLDPSPASNLNGANLPLAGETITFRVYMRFNNANGQYFNGNAPNSDVQWFQVWEIAQ